MSKREVIIGGYGRPKARIYDYDDFTDLPKMRVLVN